MPNFSYMLYYLFGTTPDQGIGTYVKSYGFFLVLGIFLTTQLFKRNLRQKEKEGAFGTFNNKNGEGYNGLFTDNFLHAHTIFAVTCGLIGSKVIVLLENLSDFINTPIDTFFNTGIAAYGGLIFGALGSYLYFRRYKIPFLYVLDAVSPGLFLSYATARIGCHLSGDGCWGITASDKPKWWFLPDWVWSYNFPHNVLKQGIDMEGCNFLYNKQLAIAVFPTSFYELVTCFLLFLLLWHLSKSIKQTGLLFCIYLIMNGIERFFIEFIRINEKYKIFIFYLSQAQIIAIGIICIGIILYAYLRKTTFSAN